MDKKMGFTKIDGQKRAIALLKAGFRTRRISHAYLFYGPQGVGKFKAALVFAQLLNCDSPVEEEPCGCCSPCRKIASGNHPDLEVIKPDGASIKIEQMRVLQEKVYLKCYEGKFKVIMIDEAHLLTLEAANSLLKVLEEPPAETVFILLADDLNKLPVTIQSRCQPLPFAYLEETAMQSLSKALGMAESDDYQQFRSKAEDVFVAIKNEGYAQLFSWAEKLDQEKNLAEIILEWLLVLYRDRMVLLSTDGVDLANGSKARSFTANSGIENFSGADLAGCFAAIEEINKAVYSLKNNGNYRLTIEVLFIKLRNIEQRERWG
ncbi:MAG: DNA polymerase III subunit delta' [Paludibacteraceae bacterium]